MLAAAACWHSYYNPDELEEIDRAIRPATVRADDVELRVRVYEQPDSTPTVLVAHGLLGYGLAFARFHLPFWRRGWRVVQFDLPGMGESGGPRGAATVREMIAAWQAVAKWTGATWDGPLCVTGNAEDGVVAYYALANNPSVAAMSVHTLFEYGDPGGVGWVRPPWAVHGIRPALQLAARLRPGMGVPGAWTIPWRHVFAGAEDAAYRRQLAADPLSLRRGCASLGYSIMQPFPPPVRFEDCATPVQVIISTRSRIWPARTVRQSAERLGGPREIIELDAPHWEMSRAFHERYCALVVDWFERWSGRDLAAQRGAAGGVTRTGGTADGGA
jgi:alpha-beta hydrolase superfamily lysophospholipase